MIGTMTTRLSMLEWSSQQDDTGGIEAILSNSSDVWAKVENKRGNGSFFSGQKVFNYDYKITIRYNPTFTENNTILYNGKNLKILSLGTIDEQAKKFFEIKAVAAESDLGGILVNGAVYRVDFSGNGTTTQTIPEVIGKRIITFCSDGLGFGAIITVGNPENKQVKFDTATGDFTTAMPLETDQQGYILYQ